MAHIDCVCPPRADGTTRHPKGDEVELRERLDFHAAVAVRQGVRLLYLDDPEASAGEALATFSEQYLVSGITSWTLRDDKDKPVPVTKANIRRFMSDHLEAAMTVADEADNLYSEAVLLPLVRRGLNSSPPTPTESSTSAPTGSNSETPTPSSSSSTPASQTDDTETTSLSLVGASN